MKRNSFTPLFIFLALAIGLGTALLQPKAKTEGKIVDMPALALPAMKGKATLQLDAMKGDVALINFFASWCTPCAAEMPELADLKKQFPNVKFHGVVWNDTPETLTPWLKEHGNPFTSLWVDDGGKAAVALGIRGIPETYLIDRTGKVRMHIAGPINPMTRGEVIETLKQLEGEHAPR